MRKFFLALPLFWCVFLLVSPVRGAQPTEPPQPAQGLGGSASSFKSVLKTRIGAYEDKTYLFEPDNPRPKKAPVAIFLHDWLEMKPEYYQGWIDHLCKRGWIVIFPSYQGMGEPVERYSYNVFRSLKQTFGILYDGGHVEPDRDRVAIIGHEAGGVLAVNVAAAARQYKLPVPKVLMILMPSRFAGGGNTGAAPGPNSLGMVDLSRIVEGTKMLVVVGEHDERNGETTAREIFYGADNVRHFDKDYLTLLTDVSGTPALVADRWAPLCPIEPILQLDMDRRRYEFITMQKQKRFGRFVRSRGIDSMDYLGFWRLFDGLCDAAFYGQGKDEVLGNTPQQRFMGTWSDGRPVRGLLSTDRP